MKCRRTACRRSASAHRGLCRHHYDRYLAANPSGRGNVVEVRDHVARLYAAGMTSRRVSELSGVSRNPGLTSLFREGRSHILGTTASRLLAIPVPESREEYGNHSVPAVGTIRRLRALVAIGYSFQEICVLAGFSKQVLSAIVGGDKKKVSPGLADRVARVFDQHQLLPRSSRRSILRAQRNGWHPPLAWNEDEIDNPLAEPQTPTRSKRSEWEDTYIELRGMGLVEERIAERMGLSRASLMQHLRRLEAA